MKIVRIPVKPNIKVVLTKEEALLVMHVFGNFDNTDFKDHICYVKDYNTIEKVSVANSLGTKMVEELMKALNR